MTSFGQDSPGVPWRGMCACSGPFHLREVVYRSSSHHTVLPLLSLAINDAVKGKDTDSGPCVVPKVPCCLATCLGEPGVSRCGGIYLAARLDPSKLLQRIGKSHKVILRASFSSCQLLLTVFTCTRGPVFKQR